MKEPHLLNQEMIPQVINTSFLGSTVTFGIGHYLLAIL